MPDVLPLARLLQYVGWTAFLKNGPCLQQQAGRVAVGQLITDAGSNKNKKSTCITVRSLEAELSLEARHETQLTAAGRWANCCLR